MSQKNLNFILVCVVALLFLCVSPAKAQLNTSGNNVQITQGGNTAQVLTSAPGSDTGQPALAVRIISSLAGAGGTSSSFGSAFPSNGTAMGLSDGTNMRPGLAIDADTGAGTQYVQGINLVKRASGGSVEFGTATDPIRVDPTGTTTQPVSGTVTANAGTGTFNIQANASVNLNQVGGNAAATGNGTATTGTQRVTIASDNTAFSVNAVQSGTWNVGLNAGTNLIGKVVKSNTCGTTAFDSGLTENVATGAGSDLATAATCVEALFVTNTTSSAVNVTVKDKSGTPKSYVTTFSIPGNSNIILPLWGMKFTGGVTVVSGTSTALNAQVVGYQ